VLTFQMLRFSQICSCSVIFCHVNALPCMCRFNVNNLVEFVFKDLRHQLAFSWVIFIDAMDTGTLDFGGVIFF
jgi:hypothetical protein